VSFRQSLVATPSALKVGMAEAMAYRAQMAVWVLSTTMPFVMLAMWSAVAADGPVGRFTSAGFGAYFLCTFIVRQLTSSWVAWQMNYEVRTGVMSMRLLKPIHPIWHYGMESVAFIPMKLVIALPVAALLLVTLGRDAVASDWMLWALWVVALVGGWSINFLASAAIGCLSLFMSQSIKVMDVWFVCFSLFSGYLIPVELFPAWALPVVDVLPFRFVIGFPVQLMTGALSRGEALALLAGQWGWVAFFLGSTALLWRTGLKRFGAYGG